MARGKTKDQCGSGAPQSLRVLSHDLLHFASQGLMRTQFLPRVAKKLIQSSGCDELELWVKEDEDKHCRFRMDSAAKKPFMLQFVPCALGKEGDDAPKKNAEWEMENLCNRAIRENGYHTGDARGGAFKSLALIPIHWEEGCVGLLVLKSKTKNHFTQNDIEFYKDVSQTLGIALAYQYAHIELRERIKELTCLYGIAQVVAPSDADFEETIRGILELLPPAWLHPEIAAARIMLDGRPYTTAGFRETPYRQTSNILVNGVKRGFVEVVYLAERPELDEGPFLFEERKLIDIVAREVALFYERRKAEEENILLQDQLRHADRLATIGQLAAGVAHELNEPLGNILGFAQLARKCSGIPEQADQDLHKIQSASLHAREIIKKLMVFARQLPAAKTRIKFNDVVEEALYFFDARCVKAGIELKRRLAQDLPEITADPGQLNQVLVNLVVNAIQAMPEGGSLLVETRVRGDHVVLAVEDTGTGMPPEVQDQVFIPFFTTKDVNEGTGLGLAVVHGIVTSHRGQIHVTSKPGLGSRFEVKLPIEDAEDKGESN